MNMNVNPMLKTILSSLFKKSATLPYPKKPKKTFPATRGHVEVDIEQCILCGMCQRKCPTGAITVDRTAKTWTIAAYDCCQCKSCVDNCPKKCLRMENTATAPMLKQVSRTEKKSETAEGTSVKATPVKTIDKPTPSNKPANTIKTDEKDKTSPGNAPRKTEAAKTADSNGTTPSSAVNQNEKTNETQPHA
jgi:ech hydrogenase subunit F